MEVFAICGGVVFWPMAAFAWWHFTKKAAPWIRYGGFTGMALVVALACWGTFRTFQGESLVQASCEGDLSSVQRLLGEGASPNADIEGLSALGCALGSGHDKVVRVLLERGADASRLLDSGNLEPKKAQRLQALVAQASRRRNSQPEPRPAKE